MCDFSPFCVCVCVCVCRSRDSEFRGRLWGTVYAVVVVVAGSGRRDDRGAHAGAAAVTRSSLSVSAKGGGGRRARSTPIPDACPIGRKRRRRPPAAASFTPQLPTRRRPLAAREARIWLSPSLASYHDFEERVIGGRSFSRYWRAA